MRACKCVQMFACVTLALSGSSQLRYQFNDLSMVRPPGTEDTGTRNGNSTF